jgi:hypothetical protein
MRGFRGSLNFDDVKKSVASRTCGKEKVWGAVYHKRSVQVVGTMVSCKLMGTQ